MAIPENRRPYFSIVMPTYGVEKYIRNAIDSILSQTFECWELIIVDDCTPDESVKIAKEYIGSEDRIRIIRHEQNRGLSAARNTGLKEARGKYIWFMDPDDYVDSDLLENVFDSLEDNPAELVVFGHCEEYYDKSGNLSYTNTICPEQRIYKSQREMRKNVIYLEQQTLYGYAWNKFYQLSYIRKLNLKYSDVKLIEDIKFNVEFCMDIHGMNILGITPYHYAKRLEGNLTNKFVPDYFKLHKQRIEMLFEQYKYWEMDTTEIRRILGSLYGRYILSALQRNCDRRSGMSHAMRYKWCRALFCDGLFCELIPYARAKESRTLDLALKLLRRKNAFLCLSMGRGVYVIRNKLPMIYSRVKSGR